MRWTVPVPMPSDWPPQLPPFGRAVYLRRPNDPAPICSAPPRLTGLFAALKWGAALPAAGVCSAVQLRAQQEERSWAE